MLSSSAGPCSKPCLNNSIPPGATLPAGLLFALVGVLPCWGVLPPSGPLCVSPPWRLCAAFSFSGCNFTRLYFSFALWLSCGVVRRLRLACVGVWRFPWPSVGRSRGGGACISCRRCSRLRASGAVMGAVRVQAWPEAVRACLAWDGRFFAEASLIAPPGLPGEGVCLRQSRRGKIKAPPTIFTVSGAEL